MSSDRRWPAVAVCAVLLFGCGGQTGGGSTSAGSGISGGVSSTSKAGVSTTVPSSVAPSSAPSANISAQPATPAAAGSGDWDGTRYDFGHIVTAQRRGQTAVIVFDREQFFTPQGLRSGKELTEEPIRYGNSDVASVNDNPATRDFVLAPDAEVLYLEYPSGICMDQRDEAPNWKPISIDALLGGAYQDRKQVSLTFGPTGQVTRVRLSTSC